LVRGIDSGANLRAAPVAGTREVGVLALQGSSAPHVEAFARLGVAAREVRYPRGLEGLTHLVLPGGESTTLHHLLTLFGLWDPLRERSRNGTLALFGTCAGAILLGRAPHLDGAQERPPRLGLLDAVVERNAYGRQVDSRVATVDVVGEGRLQAAFIRAPRFSFLGPSVRVLARLGRDPVLVEDPAAGLLAASFHPELADDPAHRAPIHERFLRMVPPAAGAAPATEARLVPRRPLTPTEESA